MLEHLFVGSNYSTVLYRIFCEYVNMADVVVEKKAINCLVLVIRI